MATTPAKGRPYPVESDVPDVASDLHALALSLDNAPNSWQGTLAGRASVTPTTGDRYVVEGDSTAANNGIEWYWTGAAWLALADGRDTGWVNVTFGSGAANNPGQWAVSARLKGTTGELRGGIHGSGGGVTSGATLLTLPTTTPSMHPTNTIQWNNAWDTGVGAINLTLSTAGVLTSTGSLTGSAHISLDGFKFSVS